MKQDERVARERSGTKGNANLNERVHAKAASNSNDSDIEGRYGGIGKISNLVSRQRDFVCAISPFLYVSRRCVTCLLHCQLI